MMRGQLRDFVRSTETGKVGLIAFNDQCGGVFRGHALVWFGEMRDDKPVLRHVCVAKLELVDGWLQETEPPERVDTD